jgi:hypothetical protein
VVFNFPEGDTVIVQRQSESYYGIVLDTMHTIALSMKMDPELNRDALMKMARELLHKDMISWFDQSTNATIT